jgi:dihydrofolate synthase/folylpolyglutamate synthase
LDHTDLLGSTLPEIAREKAGIFKRKVAAVIGEEALDIRELLTKTARAIGSDPILVIDEAYQVGATRVSARGTTFSLRRGTDKAEVTTPLVGRHQARNTTIAIAAVNAIDAEYYPELSWISSALEGVFLPGRFQRRGKFIFDVAHNPAGARTVADTLVALKLPVPRTALVAVLADKDWRGIIHALAAAVDRFIFTSAPSATPERAWNPASAHAFAHDEGYLSELEPDFDTALSRAENHSETVVITGSFHTVGDAMSRLQVSPFAA